MIKWIKTALSQIMELFRKDYDDGQFPPIVIEPDDDDTPIEIPIREVSPGHFKSPKRKRTNRKRG